MAFSTGGAGVQSTPNVTPMIDVMLVLLIIFMVVTPALMAGFNATPPVAINLKDHPEDEELDVVLGLDKDGGYYLNKVPYAEAAVGPKLNEIYSSPSRDNYVMYLKADKDLKYSKVQDAMEVAAKNKVRMVGLVSDQKSGTISTVEGDTKATAPVGQLAPPGGND
jgi:biopolymer transport protein TolR